MNYFEAQKLEDIIQMLDEKNLEAIVTELEQSSEFHISGMCEHQMVLTLSIFEKPADKKSNEYIKRKPIEQSRSNHDKFDEAELVIK